MAATLSEADTLLDAADARFVAIIIDPEMPDGNGHAYIAKLRQQGHKMPIIVVTASGDEADVVRILNAGAVDYLMKPLRFNELLARLRAQLRVFDNSEHATFMIGQYSFRPAAKLLIDRAGRRLRLTNKEVQILKFLYRAGAKPVTRSMLLDEVSGVQCRRDQPHPGNPHLPPSAEDRLRASGHRPRQLSVERRGSSLNHCLPTSGSADPVVRQPVWVSAGTDLPRFNGEAVAYYVVCLSNIVELTKFSRRMAPDRIDPGRS